MKITKYVVLLGLTLVLTVSLLAGACTPATPTDGDGDCSDVEADLAASEKKVDQLEDEVAGLEGDVEDLEDEIAALQKPAEVYKWKYQQFRSPAEWGTLYYENMLENQLPILTDGRMEVEFFYAGELIKSTEIFDATGTGLVELAGNVGLYYSGIMPEAQIEFSMPFDIPTPSEVTNFYWGVDVPGYWGGWRFIDELREVYAEHNIRLISAGIDCNPNGFMFTFPINSIDDIKGKKVRCSGIMVDWINKLGGEGVYIPGEETYSALATGAIDGVSWGGAMGMHGMGFHEIAKYILYPMLHPCSTTSYQANMNAWNSLPDDLKATLELAFISANHDFNDHQTWPGEVWCLNDMVTNYGVTKVELTGDDLETARDAAFEIWDEVAATSPRCAEFLDMKKDYLRTMGHID